MATHKPFRELIKPGSNFEFVGRTRVWVMLSIVLIAASIGMLFVNNAMRGSMLNWTIDFKGGTEVIFAFRDAASGAPAKVGVGEVRQSLEGAGFDGIEVSGYSFNEDLPNGESRAVEGILVRTPTFGVADEQESEQILDSFEERFADRGLTSLTWSGNRIYVRAQTMITEAEASTFFSEQGKEMKPWDEVQSERFSTLNQAIGVYEQQFAVWGVERQFETALEASLQERNLDASLIQSWAVGARAGDELRDDGIKSLFYAIALIMLYLAFRFDVRYAPGAVVALLHDALLVTGVFAVTWTEVSLTSVAALLTVIGYSVNDTVIIFDRIRENAERLKDKRLERVVNISLNETLSRTLLTSLTLFVVTVMMNVFGTGEVANFAFAMNIGVIVGVYSSIFVASPTLIYLDKKFYGGSGKSSKKGGASNTKTKAKSES
ncbi:protein translocase subunit SecF [Haliangium ochraceum]|uniref:Protein-export membrane protein SecF n=1 Tax=Haliangium ochraceum (strain DSM 14365 / JCM 11303 / SMP-2) TaxID=502025 RepID=D0LJ87_HALO1|nr:protein translocase subunit SecF [Haliangium ochraceum]ACY14934.1 protein-export membrane protein SecF [Haliangium ochraceum DSM 14365]